MGESGVFTPQAKETVPSASSKVVRIVDTEFVDLVVRHRVSRVGYLIIHTSADFIIYPVNALFEAGIGCVR